MGNQYGNASQSTAMMSNGGLSSQGHHGRIRESSSGALVGKNIAGVGGLGGKSSSNLLKQEERVNLTKINMLGSQDPKKFVTHAFEDSKKRQETASAGPDSASHKSQLPAKNLQIQRITSQQDR